jgi:hypothetical protein
MKKLDMKRSELKSLKTNTLFNIDTQNTSIPLIVHGQSVFIFHTCTNSHHFSNNMGQCFYYKNKNIISNEEVSFTFYNVQKTDGLKVLFNKDKVYVLRLSNSEQYIDISNNKGLTDKKGAYYWFSLDSQNQRSYAGIGEARLETKIYEYIFLFDNDETRKANKSFLESLVMIDAVDNNIKPIQLLRDPITLNVPMIIKNTDDLSMDDIANGKYLAKANLSLISQKLYDCISGKNFVLNSHDFPEFSQAIEHSIRTKGLWCNTRLEEKSREFNKDVPNIYETYLRITLSQNSGNSPGIPYVLEIWPVGHYSPIHNHANSNAIIRVLHGSINVSLFPYLSEEEISVEPFANCDFNTENITWISPTLNQIHQLKNLEINVDTCITIQCYMYENENTLHYDYFDYRDNSGKKQPYEPDSDMDFINFKKIMKDEWNNRYKK